VQTFLCLNDHILSRDAFHSACLTSFRSTIRSEEHPAYCLSAALFALVSWELPLLLLLLLLLLLPCDGGPRAVSGG